MDSGFFNSVMPPCTTHAIPLIKWGIFLFTPFFGHPRNSLFSFSLSLSLSLFSVTVCSCGLLCVCGSLVVHTDQVGTSLRFALRCCSPPVVAAKRLSEYFLFVRLSPLWVWHRSRSTWAVARAVATFYWRWQYPFCPSLSGTNLFCMRNTCVYIYTYI